MWMFKWFLTTQTHKLDFHVYQKAVDVHVYVDLLPFERNIDSVKYMYLHR